MTFSTLTFKFVGDKGAKAGGVEDAGHANDALARESAQLVSSLGHGIQRIRHHNQNAIGRILHDLTDDRTHDLVIGVEQVVAAHPRLTGNAGCDDDDVRVRRVLVIVGAGNVGVALLDGHGFEQIKAFALWDAFDDVDQNDVG